MWRTVKLGEYINVQNGYAFNSKLFDADGEIGLIRIRDLKEGVSTETKYTGDYDRKFVVQRGDLLIGMDGEFRCYEWKGEYALLNQRVCRLQDFDNELDKRFLLYAINDELKKIEDVTGFTTVKHLSSKAIKEIPLYLPPIEEQQSIVAKLDAAFAEIDRTIFNIEGKVRNAEKIYLNGIDAHFKNKSETLKTSKLIEISSKIGSGATPKGGKAAYKTEGISLIRSMNVHDMNFKWKDLAKIDNAQADALSNVEIFKDDVLLNITGASVARCCVVEASSLPARVNQHVAIIRPVKDTVLPKYLAYLLVSKTYKDLLLSVGEGGGATRQAITKAEIEQFRISYPSNIDEQITIIEKFDKLHKQALNLKAIYQKQIDEFQSLKSAILAQELQSEAA